MSKPEFVGGRDSRPEDEGPSIAWFCLRSHPKHEHIAAGHLRQMEDVEVYNPRIRFSRSTRQGPVWVTEALFPNYLFARFDWRTSLPRVHYAPGVSCVVHFGSRWPRVPDQVIADLQATLGTDDIHIIPKDFQPGDTVNISGGAFHGLNAVITKVMPGRERVMVLMEFLGRQSTVEIGVTSIVKEGDAPLEAPTVETYPSLNSSVHAPPTLGSVLDTPGPILALAPMQDITDWPFLALLAGYGGAHLYFTEYFRVHSTSNLDRNILRSIVENPTGRPIIAQLIGNDIPALVRTAQELQQYPVAGIDLNLGCPAPVVYRKCAGGGLLREPERIHSILGSLREAITGPFTVKTRIGFDSADAFEELLGVFSRHRLDLLTVHGRTVKQMYQPGVHYDRIAQAVASLPFPVLANGDVFSADKALEVLQSTGAAGLMIGRGAIRNPWLFSQIGQASRGQPITPRTARELLDYIRALYAAVRPSGASGNAQVQKMKKYLNFIGLGVGSGLFLHQIRRASTETEFFQVCETFLDNETLLGTGPFEAAPPVLEAALPAEEAGHL